MPPFPAHSTDGLNVKETEAACRGAKETGKDEPASEEVRVPEGSLTRAIYVCIKLELSYHFLKLLLTTVYFL